MDLDRITQSHCEKIAATLIIKNAKIKLPKFSTFPAVKISSINFAVRYGVSKSATEIKIEHKRTAKKNLIYLTGLTVFLPQ